MDGSLALSCWPLGDTRDGPKPRVQVSSGHYHYYCCLGVQTQHFDRNSNEGDESCGLLLAIHGNRWVYPRRMMEWGSRERKTRSAHLTLYQIDQIDKDINRPAFVVVCGTIASKKGAAHVMMVSGKVAYPLCILLTTSWRVYLGEKFLPDW